MYSEMGIQRERFKGATHSYTQRWALREKGLRAHSFILHNTFWFVLQVTTVVVEEQGRSCTGTLRAHDVNSSTFVDVASSSCCNSLLGVGSSSSSTSQFGQESIS
jgi:hypothetical protein